jgi:dihydrofolate synthase/folylpolyglutamate synthase
MGTIDMCDYKLISIDLDGTLLNEDNKVSKENLCAIITQIDLDHTDRLGKTKDEIAFEKAGIIKPNCPVVTSMGYEAIRDRADELNAMLLFSSPYVPQSFVEALSLKGLHQIENLALVLTAINYLFKEIDENTIKCALMKTKNPYRFEYFADKNLIVDASHNPNGIKALRENLDYYYPNLPRRFVFGCLKNKDYSKMMGILFKDDDEVYLNEFDYPNACSYEELSNACFVNHSQYKGQSLLTDKLNIVCGSFYMLSDLLKQI